MAGAWRRRRGGHDDEATSFDHRRWWPGFEKVYEELGILPHVATRALEQFATYRDVRNGTDLSIGRDLDATARALASFAPEDAEEIRRLMQNAKRFANLDPGIDQPRELMSWVDRVRQVWHARHEMGLFAEFSKPHSIWSKSHFKNAQLRCLLSRIVPEDAPAFLLLLILGYLGRGFLSRPVGGTAAFRDALIATHERLGGETRLHATVDEILVDNDRARGVRLSDGSFVRGDLVVSTSSMPETVFRLLGGRYGADDLLQRLERWQLFQPVALVSFGVESPLRDVPPTLLIDGIEPFMVGGRENDYLYIRTFNDDPSVAPPGHTVVQLLLQTDYDWWSTRGTSYAAEREALARLALARLEPHVPGIGAKVRATDVATPLTFWRTARSWRGAFEGWMPSLEGFIGHVSKTLPGLGDFYMAGQWVEPGGGVPTALASGRQVVQVICEEERREFKIPRAH